MGNFGGTKSKTYPLCPEGPQQVVCVDVIDVGLVQTDFGEKQKVRLVFQSAAIDSDSGKPYQISSQLTASLHEKATLSRLIEGWLRKLSPEERELGISETMLLGMNGFANIVHNERAGKTYANIGSLMPLPKGVPPIVPIDYTRKKDRPEQPDRQNGDL